MIPAPATQIPLAIDRVERARAAHDQVRLRLTGRWLAGGEASAEDAEALLVVQLQGRRHRFPEARDDRDAGPRAADAPFTASFTIPDWAVPEQSGQAVLWVGDAVVPVPAPGTALAPPPPATVAAPAPDSALERALASSEPLASAAGRAGPLAELLFKETVSALHAELEQRATEGARLRSAVAEARAELERRGGVQAGLESAHAELREELGRLMAAVAEQREEFEARLAAASAERDHLRGEQESARGQLAAARAELDGARTERDDARGERERAREELSRARAQADQELAALRATADAERADAEAGARAEAERHAETEIAEVRREAERELTTSRAETEAMLGAARSQWDARSAAAEAEARQLGERVAALTAAERRRAEELALLREQLAAAHIARDAALGEAGGLRAELERLGSELATVREQGEGPGEDLSEAQRLLADARALTEQLRSESSG